MTIVLEVFDKFLFGYLDKETRTAAMFNLWDAIQSNYDNFSDQKIPDLMLAQATDLQNEFKNPFKSKSKLVIKHRDIFRFKIEQIFHENE